MPFSSPVHPHPVLCVANHTSEANIQPSEMSKQAANVGALSNVWRANKKRKVIKHTLDCLKNVRWRGGMTCRVLGVCRQRHVSCISSANRHTHFGRRVANKFGKRTRPELVGSALKRCSSPRTLDEGLRPDACVSSATNWLKKDDVEERPDRPVYRAATEFRFSLAQICPSANAGSVPILVLATVGPLSRRERLPSQLKPRQAVG